MVIFSSRSHFCKLSEAIGLGKSEVFDPALIHCTESLCTNFWIGFAANVRDGKASKFSKSSIKSAAPKYLHTAALSVFCLKAAKMPYFNFQGFDRLRSVRLIPSSIGAFTLSYF